MKKQFALLGALFLACGSGSFAYAAPAPAIVASSEATQIVKGTVVDENGEPVIGASVTEPEPTAELPPTSTVSFQSKPDATPSFRFRSSE